jgi:putative FmdB family regulatory protein
MPVYDYRCSACGYGFELKLSFRDNGDSCCPKCGAKANRLFIPVPIIFKGPGFYVTDHRPPENPTTTTPKPSPVEASSATSKSETKSSTSKST